MNKELLKRIITSIVLIPSTLFFIIKGSNYFIFFILICFFISSYEWYLISKNKKYFLPGMLFLSFSFFTFYTIRFENFGLILTIFIILICAFTDTGGYLFGRIFKGPKLTSLSPKKTYSGMIGGYLLSMLAAGLFLYYYQIENEFYNFYILELKTFIIIFVISSISQIGDIIISYFKRLSKKKDTGKILPGHGGLLDRVDGMIFAFPFFYIFSKII